MNTITTFINGVEGLCYCIKDNSYSSFVSGKEPDFIKWLWRYAWTEKFQHSLSNSEDKLELSNKSIS